MKRALRPIISLLAVAAIATACEQELYEQGDAEYSQTTGEFVEAFTDSEKKIGVVVTDENERLTLKKPLEPKWATTADSTYRAVLYYNKVGTMADAVSLSLVQTASIFSLSDVEWGDKRHPVGLQSSWVSTSGKYLNVALLIKTGHAEGDAARHRLAVIDDGTATWPDGSQTKKLRLLHDRGDMPEYFTERLYFSIPLKNISTDSVSLSLTTYDGEYSKTHAIK